MKEAEKFAAKAKKELDTNGDGKISKSELLSSHTLKFVLGAMLSLMLGTLLLIIKDWVSGINPTDSFLGLVGTYAVPFMMTYFLKSTTDDYQGRVKEGEKAIKLLETQVLCEKAGRQDDNAKSELELLQLTGAMDLKNQEIQWLKEGYPEYIKDEESDL